MMLLQYLKKEYGVTRAGDVPWSHAVNSREKLDRCLSDPKAMFVESDIRISKSGVAVAAHPPETESDLTFDELISRMRESKQGLKLDFKDPEILAGCLEKLAMAKLSQPVLLNADILRGNGANPSKFSAVGFLALCKKYYPAGALSLGWTTVADLEEGYTKRNVDDMIELCRDISEATFPVRACLMPNSYGELKRLIAQGGYTLTVWNNESVSDELKDWMKKNTDPEKTFYDFVDDDKEPLRLF